MTAKKSLLVIGLSIIIIIGGIIMVRNPFTGEEEPKYKYEQDRIARYLVKNYELTDGAVIEKIEFIEFQRNEMTGYWRITTMVNNKYYISFSEKQIGDKLEGEGYYPDELRERLENNQSINIESIKIVYLEE